MDLLFYAMENVNKPPDTTAASVAAGEAFTMSILPIIKIYSEDASKKLENNMIIQPRMSPVVDGLQAVADALSSVMKDFGIPFPCSVYMGTVDTVHLCSEYSGAIDSTFTFLMILAGMSFLAIIVAATIITVGDYYYVVAGE